MAKKKVNKRYETYDGVGRVLKGWATVFREPVQKGDTFEHEGALITRILRGGEPLYELGQEMRNSPGEPLITVVHLEVDPNPGNMWPDEAAREGFVHLGQFTAAYRARYGEIALWRPAWRIRVERQAPQLDNVDEARAEFWETTMAPLAQLAEEKVGEG